MTAPTDITLGWVIVYVDDPVAAITFYEQTFGLQREFAAPDGSYGQLLTGATKLGFASYALGEANFPAGVRRTDTGQPANVEIVLVSADVDALHDAALQAGCTELAKLEDKPHGQRVGWVRDPFGTLLELATPM